MTESEEEKDDVKLPESEQNVLEPAATDQAGHLDRSCQVESLCHNPTPVTPEREANDPLYPDDYYEYLEQAFGPEKAAWARLPRAQRMEELKKIHERYNTPDDLDPIPPELGGGVWNP